MIQLMPLEDVCEDIIDCPHESPEWLDSGIPIIRNFNLVNGVFDFTEAYYVDEETYRQRVRRAVPTGGDIIFSREAPIGNCAIVPDNFKCCLGQRLVLLRANKEICSSEYLLTVLMSGFVKKQIEQIAKSGSIVSNFNIGDLKKLQIPVIEKYEGAAKLAQLINKKRVNNISIADKYERLANYVYKYWFVQFDFPNSEGKPYKSSGGEMIWSEELGYEIPRGWEVKKLGDLLYENNTSISPDENIPTLDLSVMPSNRISQFTINDSDNFETNLFEMRRGDLLFGSIRPYLKKAGFAPCNGAVAGTVHSFRAKEEDYNFFALVTLCSELMFKYAIKNSKGTKMPVIGADDLLEFKLPFNKEIARKFNSYNYMNQVTNLIDENHSLERITDYLVPLLMTEQVEAVV